MKNIFKMGRDKRRTHKPSGPHEGRPQENRYENKQEGNQEHRPERRQEHRQEHREENKQDNRFDNKEKPHRPRREGDDQKRPHSKNYMDKRSFYRNKPQEILPVYDSHDDIPIPSEEDFLFLPIGGSGEIGMNVNLYGHNKQWIMVDLGITFSDEPYGFDLVTANLEIVKNTSIGKLLKGVVITHAHEDHIGAVHELWPYFKFHIYLTKFSKEILLRKLEDKPYIDELSQYYLHEVPYHGHIKVGDFDIQYLDITHSIPESNALVIKTPAGNLFHTGDWKLDPHPGMGEPPNEVRYRQLSREKMMAMVCDSTNSMSKGRSGSEEQVAEAFDKLFRERTKNRIAVTCFASNVGRVKVIADLARKYGRKVCLLGRSLHKMVEAADQCQYPIHIERFISDMDAFRLKPHEVLYICTGSQGDEKAALMKISRNLHRLKLSEGDAVYFSSKCIPGNERRINVLQNNLTRLGVDIFTEKDAHIHVSGHPNQDELQEMYDWVKPHCVVPVHGEIRHLHEHAKFAKRCGFNSLVPENGTLVDIKKQKIIRRYNIGRIVLDGNRFINYESPIVKERKAMGAEGIVFLSIKDNFVFVSSHGLVDGAPDEFNKRVREGVKKALHTHADTMKNPTLRDMKIIEYIKNLVRHMYNKMPEVKIHWLKGEG